MAADDPPRFYIDEDVGEALATVLRRLGYDAVTTRQAGNKGARDARQLAFAAHHRRALVTCNRGDFALLHDAWVTWTIDWGIPSRFVHHGILIIPNGREVAVSDAGEVIDDLVKRGEPLTIRLLRWRATTGWQEIRVP